MSNGITEWDFTSQVKSWIDQIIARSKDLPFSEARCEQRGTGSNRRRDLTLLNKDGQIVLTGEVKLPYRNDGNTPYRAEVVADARAKAKLAGCDYFFTWNVNECVLWETAGGAALPDKTFERWKVTNVARQEHIDQPPTVDAINRWLVIFLHEFAKILRGHTRIGRRSPDQKFVEALESALSLPIRYTQEELFRRYESKTFKRDLDEWMRSLGWVIRDDAEGVRDNIERAAKFSCYLLVNKLVFHEALLKRYGSNLDPLTTPPEVDTGEMLRVRLEGFFADAKRITGDYETIFGDQPNKSIGNRIPFYANSAVASWRGLIEQIHEFDFSKLDYEIIGSIFERLIGPEERHKYGQFYTCVEVVDLINSFCIHSSDATVLDPACGGGTFLVRAYGRKRELAADRKHRELLTELYGIDISQFATHLTTMNLATRDLVEEENYPRVGREDFFNVLPKTPFVHLPQKLMSKGLGKNTALPISIPPLDAVIANPPYVRQEEIPKARLTIKEGGPEKGTKDFYLKCVRELAGAELSGRSDLHCYFWPHAAKFLKQGGMLGFITSSQWLDVEYGFKLQKWLLSNFEILAVLESISEPWFDDARVSTAVTIARRCDNQTRRMANTVRFVQLRLPLAEILGHDGTMGGAVVAADRLRDEILNLSTNTSNCYYRARLVNQGALWNEGVELGCLMSKGGNGDISKGEEVEDENAVDTATVQIGDYYGGKWGVHVRAPDLWFDLLDKFGHRFTPLGELAQVRFGVKSGKDAFFFPKDYSQDCLTKLSEPIAFEQTYGVPRRLVKSGEVKLVLCGKGRGEIKPIESKYLEPEIHSLMEIKGFTVRPEDCSRMILLVPDPKENLKGTYVLNYIEWGEKNGWHDGSTCAARVTDTRDWYVLTGHKRGEMFWPMAQQYKHAIPINDHQLIANHNLFDIDSRFSEPENLAAVLNSSLTLLSKFQFGRPVGVEGNLKTEVIDVKMMQVPNPAFADKAIKRKLTNAMLKIKQRDALQLISPKRLRRMAYERIGKHEQLEQLSDQCELDMPDRRELDHAVLELLGIRSERERNDWINRLYEYLRGFFEEVRQKEEQAIGNKNATKRKGAASPQDIAIQIWRELRENEGEWLRPYREFLRDVVGRNANYTHFELPHEGEPSLHKDMLAGGVIFARGKRQIELVTTETIDQAELLVLMARSGWRDVVRVPTSDTDCAKLLTDYRDFLQRRDFRLRELVAERTADEDLQHKVFKLLSEQLVVAVR
jgi:methylase of polypeptide subunit release factors